MIKRYNGFWFTHKALRAMLYDAALALQHIESASAQPPAAIFEKLEELLWVYDKHGDLEDEYILPLVAASHPDLYAVFEREHLQDHALTAALRKQLAAWQHSVPDEKLFLELFYAFHDFLAFNIAHMNREETQLLEAIWEQHSDETLLSLHAKIIATREPAERVLSLRWMLKGCNNPEIAQILFNAKNQLAPESYTGFASGARQTVGETRWPAISSQLAALHLVPSA